MTPLASLLRGSAGHGTSADLTAVQSICQLLWVIVNVRWAAPLLTLGSCSMSALASSMHQELSWRACPCRGYKTVMRFFPHQVSDLEPALAILERLNAEVTPAIFLLPQPPSHAMAGFLRVS